MSSRAEVRFKQLCCLGLGAEAVMPALLRHFHDIIPCVGTSFFFSGPRGDLANIYDEHPETARIAPLYIEEFHNRPDRQVGPSFTQSMRSEKGVVVPERVFGIDPDTYHRSDMYNLLLRPLGYDTLTRLVVRDLEGRPLGGLNVYRGPGEAPFTARDLRRLASLESFLAHALMEPPKQDFALVESGEVGVLVADTEGRPIFASPEGRRLLFLATHPRVSPSATVRRLPKLPPALVRICRALARIGAGDEVADAPMHHCRNIWGGFTFRAQWLERGRAATLVAITISHQEPIPLRLARGLNRMPLSRRQGEVALLLAMGKSYGEIGERLGIATGTAIAHGRWVYQKLAVSTRVELLYAMLAA